MSRRALLSWALSAFACLLLAVPAGAQSVPAAAAPTDGAAKAQALKWIDRFATAQVLFSPGDVKRLREKVAKMTETEAAAWWTKSATHRELFDSEQWQETRKWLREFLKVQAIYSDEQVEYFQSEAFTKAEDSSRSLKEVMDEITAERQKLAAGSRSSAQMRQQQLDYRQAYLQDQVSAREAAMKASAARSASRPQPQTPVVQRGERTPTPPLVSSLDVARWSTMRNLWPGRR
ncbi:MAG: hypothetical protein HQ567_25400 [Candidatus Nealsonbacteria bacterium]|nr:hypothetical protein [Candidatus Nealsonbacteria bacterium]